MAKILSGLTGVSHAASVGGSYTALTGKISSESTIEVPNTLTETTTGNIFGGGQMTAEIMMLDFADYATAEGWMTGDTERSFTFDFQDGTSLETQVLIIPEAERQVGTNARDGVVSWVLRLERYSDGVILA